MNAGILVWPKVCFNGKKKKKNAGLTDLVSLIDPHLLLLNAGNLEFGAISVCIFIEWLQ